MGRSQSLTSVNPGQQFMMIEELKNLYEIL